MKYRVGTFSTGLLFITIGLLLFLQHWVNISFHTLFFTWWPIFLIALGSELLYFLYRQRQQPTEKIGYDIFSIFIITLFAFASLFVYTIKASGIIDIMDKRVLTASYHIDPHAHVINGIEQIERIVVSGDAHRLTLKSHEENQVLIDPAYRHVSASSLAEAELQLEDLITHERVGSTLFIKVNAYNQASPFHNHTQQLLTLYLPEHIEAEIRFEHAEIILDYIELTSEWLIKTTSGRILTYTKDESRLTIEAYSTHGNIESAEYWSFIEEDQSYASYNPEDNIGQLTLRTDYGSISFINR